MASTGASGVSRSYHFNCVYLLFRGQDTRSADGVILKSKTVEPLECLHSPYKLFENATQFGDAKRGGTGVDAFARNRTDWKGIATTRAPDFSDTLKLAG